VTHGVPADDEEPSELFREQQDGTGTGSGFAVGHSGEDVDDVSPPEMHLGEVPVGFEVDSLVPHLGSGLDGGLDPEPAPLFEFDDLLGADADAATGAHPHGDDAHDGDDGGLGDLFDL
jgi:hypothetical protein